MKRLFAALLLAVFFITGCDDSQYRKAVRATAAISSGLRSLQEANEIAFKGSEIDQDTARNIALGVADAVVANDAIVKELRSIKKLDAQSKAQVVAHIRELAVSIRGLNDSGVLHIKNPVTKAKVSGALDGVQAALSILEGLVK
jgi:hypothetical protein